MRIIRYPSPSSLARNVAPVFGRSPWGLEAEIDRVFAAVTHGPATPAVGRFPIDLYEDTTATYLRAELPGVNRADIGVEVVDGTLQLSAKRTVKTAEREETTEYRRAVTISDGALQTDRISAAYENGVLTVTLPKREEARPRKINVAVN